MPTSQCHKVLGVFLLTLGISLTCEYTASVYAADTDGQNMINTATATEHAGSDTTLKETERFAIIRGGYRFVSSADNAASATPYTRLKSGMMGGLSAGSVGATLKLSVAASFINEDDYHAELLYDGGGAYRFHLESQALWHNLLLEPLAPPTPGFITTGSPASVVENGLRISTHEADGRVRIGNNPLHLTLGYWELHREGTVQTRFSDFFSPISAGDSSTKSLLSGSSRKDQVTREVMLGLDGQLGSLGADYTVRVRDFSDQSPLNRYNFLNSAGGVSIPGNQAFSVSPDNRTVSHTIKLYTDMSGGLTGAAAYTYLQRENNGSGGDARPSLKPEDTIQAASGDLRYTPFKEISFALRYRRQQIDRESPATVSSPFLTAETVAVRPSSDSVQDAITLSSTYQPDATKQLRLEYRAELESRSDVADAMSPDNPAARHSDSRQTHTGKISASWKPVNGVRFIALYSYAECDNPAYSSSFSHQHTGQLFATVTRSHRWGATASYLGRFETADYTSAISALNTSFTLPRENLNNALNASIWFAPFNRLTITTSYSLLSNASNQKILYSDVSAESLAAANYRATVHVYGIDAVYSVSEQLDLGSAFQQIFSRSRFSAGSAQFIDPSTNSVYTTAGIADLTALDATETAVSVRANWHISPHYALSLEYGYRGNDSGNSLFNGSSHSLMTMVTGTW